jgi:hypothetical protein
VYKGVELDEELLEDNDEELDEDLVPVLELVPVLVLVLVLVLLLELVPALMLALDADETEEELEEPAPPPPWPGDEAQAAIKKPKIIKRPGKQTIFFITPPYDFMFVNENFIY